MKLPVIDHPIFDVTIPSTGIKTKIRPMLVKEEKILLMAKEGINPYEIFHSIKQVVNNCLISGDVDVNTLTLFDLEYIFLKIRSISVGNVVKVSYRDAEDGEEYPFEVDLDKIEVKFPEIKNMRVDIDSESGFQMKYPQASLYNTETFMSGEASEQDLVDELVINCIDTYFDGEKVYKLSENTKQEIKDFLNNLDINTYNKIREFVGNLPTLYYEIKYTNKNNREQTIKLTTLTDFFMLR